MSREIKHIMARLRDDLNELEGVINREAIAATTTTSTGQPTHDNRVDELKAKLAATIEDNRRLRAQKKQNPDIIIETPEVDIASMVDASVGPLKKEIRRLETELEAMKRFRVDANNDINQLRFERNKAENKADELKRELLKMRDENYPERIAKLETSLREITTDRDKLRSTIREQKLLIGKMEAKK